LKKTRSLIGKTLLATLALLVISLPLITSISAKYTVYTIPTASVFLSPSRISGASGDTVDVNVTISDIEGVSAIGTGLMFDHHTAQCTGIGQGTFMGGSTLYLAGGIYNDIGIVSTSSFTELGTNTVNGSGTFLIYHFTMNGSGTSYSDLHLVGFEVLDVHGSVIPCQTIDYSTTSAGYIVQIVGDPQGEQATLEPPYIGFSNQSFATINQVIDSNTYHGNLTFAIYSPDFAGTPGFFNVTVPNDLMNCTNDNEWMVRLNGAAQASRIITHPDSTHTVISLDFTYGSSAIETVQILSTNAVPEFSSVFLATLLVLATIAAALFGKATWSYKRKV